MSSEAFIQVSQINNDVLPRAIIEDKLDRQNCSISQRFFSEEVENILTLSSSKRTNRHSSPNTRCAQQNTVPLILKHTNRHSLMRGSYKIISLLPVNTSTDSIH